MIVALKLVHIGMIGIWAGALLVLPVLYRQRNALPMGKDMDRLHRMVRFVFIAIASPAAVVAISTGIALMFLRDTFVAWFMVKLLFVGALCMLHVFTTPLIMRLFNEDSRYPLIRYAAALASTTGVILAILFLVLAKPALDLPGKGITPGGLGEIFPDLNLLPRQ